jgi:hypothetical protein
MARPKKHDGVVYQRKGTKIWWMRYCDKGGKRHLESTGTEDWQQRKQCYENALRPGMKTRSALPAKGSA